MNTRLWLRILYDHVLLLYSFADSYSVYICSNVFISVWGEKHPKDAVMNKIKKNETGKWVYFLSPACSLKFARLKPCVEEDPESLPEVSSDLWPLCGSTCQQTLETDREKHKARNLSEEEGKVSGKFMIGGTKQRRIKDLNRSEFAVIWTNYI